MRLLEKSRNSAISVALAVAMLMSNTVIVGTGLCAEKSSQNAAASPGPAPGEATPEELEELVSPIALYPDLLLARILVASTFPTQIVEAQRWLEQNPDLKGEQFADAVNAQPWDPSVRSLSQFREVIKTMNGSLAWTSELGEAYYNQPDDVMNAIQRLRNRAVKAGTLKDTPQQKIEMKSAAPEPSEGTAAPPAGSTQQQTVIIEPAQQNTVYVPQYDPSSAYGAPVQAPAGYTGSEMLTTGLLSFGLGMGLMALINEDDDDWDCGWGGGGGGGGNTVNYNKNVYRNRGNSYPRGGRSDIRQARLEGRNPRPSPYSGRTGGAQGPSSRPYNPSNAKPFRPGGPAAAKPVFPNAGSLPANAGSRRPSTGLTGPQQNLAQDRRGYGAATPNRSTRGSNTGAFGGYAPGGATQTAGSRGRSSLGKGGGGGRGGGRRGGGGGGGRRGGGGRGGR